MFSELQCCFTHSSRVWHISSGTSWRKRTILVTWPGQWQCSSQERYWQFVQGACALQTLGFRPRFPYGSYPEPRVILAQFWDWDSRKCQFGIPLWNWPLPLHWSAAFRRRKEKQSGCQQLRWTGKGSGIHNLAPRSLLFTSLPETWGGERLWERGWGISCLFCSPSQNTGKTGTNEGD